MFHGVIIFQNLNGSNVGWPICLLIRSGCLTIIKIVLPLPLFNPVKATGFGFTIMEITIFV
ncbi:MAG: hypothetical protein ABS91_00035 [Thiobacillus sp. SCN 64-35]|nr:MAG: hypothetical protein ABS91_00035 [Thiobacillus sp. SCN 64-35]OJY60339.1 MAG: hypothetical protein BGP19_15950 [Thiobacillus sp. 0-1251]